MTHDPFATRVGPEAGSSGFALQAAEAKVAELSAALEDARMTIDSLLHQCWIDNETPVRFSAAIEALHNLCYKRIDPLLVSATPTEDRRVAATSRLIRQEQVARFVRTT